MKRQLSPTPERTKPLPPPPPETIDYSGKTEEWIDEEIERLTVSCFWVEKDDQNEYKKHEVEQLIEWLKFEKFRRTLTEVPLAVRLQRMIDWISNESMLTKGGAKVAMLATLVDLRAIRVRTDRDWADEDHQTINLMKEECELLSREFENGIIRNRPSIAKEFDHKEDSEHGFDYYMRMSLLQLLKRVHLTLFELVFDLCNHVPRYVPDSKKGPNETALSPYIGHNFEVIRGLNSRMYQLKLNNQKPISKVWAWEAMADTINELRSTANVHPRWGEIYKQEIADVKTELMRLSSLFQKGHVLNYAKLVKESDCKDQEDFAFQLKYAVIATLEEFQKKLSGIISRGVD